MRTSSLSIESSSSSSSSIISSSPSLLRSLLRWWLPRTTARSRFFAALSRQRALSRSRRNVFRGGSSVAGAPSDELPCTKVFAVGVVRRRVSGVLVSLARGVLNGLAL